MKAPLLLFTVLVATLVLTSGVTVRAATFFKLQVAAATLATVTVTRSSASALRATGRIRSHKFGSAAIVLRAPEDASLLRVSCEETSAIGTHGPATLARDVTPRDGLIACAAWPGPNVFAFEVDIVFAAQPASSTPSFIGWTVLATAT